MAFGESQDHGMAEGTREDHRAHSPHRTTRACSAPCGDDPWRASLSDLGSISPRHAFIAAYPPIFPPALTALPSRTRPRSPGAGFEPAQEPGRVRAFGARRIPAGSLCLAALRTSPSSRLHVGRAGAATRSPAEGGGEPAAAEQGRGRVPSPSQRRGREEEGKKDDREAARSPRRHV